MRNPAVQSLERALAILTVLGRREGSLGISELARHLGLAKSTAHRLLGTLEQAGFVSRSAEARYRLGLQLWELGCAAVRGLNLRDAARPAMESLAQRTGETVHLSVWNQGEIVYIDKVEGTQPIRLHSAIGGRAPAHATASGLVLLAFQDLAAPVEVGGDRLARFTERTITSPVRLERRLAEIRREGYAWSVGAWYRDSAGVAAPIWSHAGTVVAALSVAAPSERIADRVPRLAGLVKTAAAKISQALGHATVMRLPDGEGKRMNRESEALSAPREQRRVPGSRRTSTAGGEHERDEQR